MQVRCDNQAVVHAVSARSCKDKPLMHLLRCLFFCEAHYHVRLSAAYLPGSLNVLADHLSRNRSVSFLSKVTDADREPSPIPERLPELLLGVGDWTSPSWTDVRTNSIAPSTQRSYRAGVNRCMSFCNAFNVTRPLPASESLLCCYVTS